MKPRLLILSMAILFLAVAAPLYGRCQQIQYSVPLGDNIRSTTFDIIGKCGSHLLIYKSAFGDHTIALYDDHMKIVDQVPLQFLPRGLTGEDFVNQGDRVLMIYQYRHRQNLYCKGVLLDENAKPLSRPRLLDRAGRARQTGESGAYGVIHSEDRSKVMVFEVLRNTDSMRYRIRTLLLDSSLQVVNRGSVQFPVTGEGSRPVHFQLSDDGNLYFIVGEKPYSTDNYFRRLTLYCKPASSPVLLADSIPLKGHVPDTSVLMKINNAADDVWVAVLQFNRREKDIDRLLVTRFRSDNLGRITATTLPLTDSLQKIMQGENEGPNGAFDDYTLNQMVIDKQENVLLIAEEKFVDLQNVTHYDNIALFELDGDGGLLKLSRIKKDQGADLAATYASYMLINSGRELHLLMNKSHRIFRFLNNYVYLLADYRYGADHNLKEMPLMRGLDNKKRWAPRFGRQISRTEVVIPCVSGSSLLFGKITYETAK